MGFIAVSKEGNDDACDEEQKKRALPVTGVDKALELQA
jgi:hypothetical protein